MSEKLLPCKRCGKEMVTLAVDIDTGKHFIRCNSCQYRSEAKESFQEAKADWNRRPTPNPLKSRASSRSDEYAGLVEDKPKRVGCGVCGGTMVQIRGRYPEQECRNVCPTCLAERMDQIREVSHPDYGVAYSAAEIPPLQGQEGGGA